MKKQLSSRSAMNVRSIQEARGPGMVASVTKRMNFAILLCDDKTPAPSHPCCDSLHVFKDNFDTGRRTRDISAFFRACEFRKFRMVEDISETVDVDRGYSNIFCQFPFLLLFPVKERIEAVR